MGVCSKSCDEMLIRSVSGHFLNPDSDRRAKESEAKQTCRPRKMTFRHAVWVRQNSTSSLVAPPTAVVRLHICGGAHALPCTGSALPRPRLGCPELRALSTHHHVRVSGPGALRGNAFPPSGLKASCAAWRSDVRRPRVNIETGKKHRARALITRLYTGPRLRVHEDGRQQGSHAHTG